MANKSEGKPSDKRAGKRNDRNRRIGTRIPESFVCCDRFAEKFERVTGQKYRKSDRNVYQKLIMFGDEEKAVQIAERCYKRCVDAGQKEPSEMWPACMVQRLVEEIQKKVGKV